MNLFLSSFLIDMTQVVYIILLMYIKDRNSYAGSQYHRCWSPGDARTHDIDFSYQV